MTDIEKIREAVKLIHDECCKREVCSDCPLNSAICAYRAEHPYEWRVKEIGVKNDD